MDRGVDIVTYQTLADEDCILVVVAFPCHESDQRVLAECDLALGGACAVCDDLTFFDFLALADDRSLVVAVGLVAPDKLRNFVGTVDAVLAADANLACRYMLNHAVFFC